MVQAIPMPRKTLTALLPVTLPTDESAYLSPVAATLLANVSVNIKAHLYYQLYSKRNINNVGSHDSINNDR